METYALTDIELIKKNYEALVEQPCHSADDLRSLNLAWNEMNMRVLHLLKRLRIAYNCNTQNDFAKKNFDLATSDVLPVLIRYEALIGKKIIEHPNFEEIVQDCPSYYKNLKVDIQLFREENTSLQIQEQELVNQYDSLIGSLKVEFQDQILPYSALSKYLESRDREERKAAFLAREKAFLAIKQEQNQIFLKLLKLRHQMALNAGFKNYRDYRFEEYKRFDYGAKECHEFHHAIEKLIIPILRELNKEKTAKLQLDGLRPWDERASIDKSIQPPFETSEQLINGCREIFQKMDNELVSFFDDMISKKTLDLEVREGKSGGGYCSDLPMEKTSFIFMNATGTRNNVETLLHEAGHAFHNYLSASFAPFYYARFTSSEFAEVASMSMELLARPYLSQYYPSESIETVLREQLIGTLDLFPLIAKIDVFQHWVYTAGEDGSIVTDAADWDNKWLELEKRFSTGIDWSDHESFLKVGWQYLHIFKYPFYFVDYGIAQIGAYILWANSLKDYQGAISSYKRALSLGGTKSLPELFEAIGAKFGLDEETLRPVLDSVKAHL